MGQTGQALGVTGWVRYTGTGVLFRLYHFVNDAFYILFTGTVASLICVISYEPVFNLDQQKRLSVHGR